MRSRCPWPPTCNPLSVATADSVDDDSDADQILPRHLEQDGHVATVAEGASRGSRPSRRARHGPPFSFVITDLGMPYVAWPQSRSLDQGGLGPHPGHYAHGWASGCWRERHPAHVDRVLSKAPRLGNAAALVNSYARGSRRRMSSPAERPSGLPDAGKLSPDTRRPSYFLSPRLRMAQGQSPAIRR